MRRQLNEFFSYLLCLGFFNRFCWHVSFRTFNSYARKEKNANFFRFKFDLLCASNSLCLVNWCYKWGVELSDLKGPFQPKPFCDSVKLSLSTVTSATSFWFLLITFVHPLLPPAKCLISALKQVILGIGFFLGDLPRLCSSHFYYCSLWKSPHPHILLWYQCLCPEDSREIYEVKYR